MIRSWLRFVVLGYILLLGRFDDYHVICYMSHMTYTLAMFVLSSLGLAVSVMEPE